MAFFNKSKFSENEYSAIRIKPEEHYTGIVAFGILTAVVMALVSLEEQGKIKLHDRKKKHIPTGVFIKTLYQKRTEAEIEKLIKSRYSINIVFEKVKKQKRNNSDFSLDDIFGLWKNRNVNLNKLRETQWGRRG